jgi:hypothetical protein
MKVYVVCGGWDYEGDRFASTQLFINEEKADEYVNDLKYQKNDTGLNEDVPPYDYVQKELMEVNE